MRYVLLLLALALSASLTQTARAEETTVRLYDAVTAFVNNPDGASVVTRTSIILKEVLFEDKKRYSIKL